MTDDRRVDDLLARLTAVETQAARLEAALARQSATAASADDKGISREQSPSLSASRRSLLKNAAAAALGMGMGLLGTPGTAGNAVGSVVVPTYDDGVPPESGGLPEPGHAGSVARISTHPQTLWMDSGSRWVALQDGVFNVASFGVVGDLKSIADGAIAAGSAILDSAAGRFEPRDVGKEIVIAGAAAGGAALTTIIAAYQSPSRVLVQAHAGATVAGAAASWGTDDTMAILEALGAASRAGGGTVYFPAGVYRVRRPLRLPADHLEIRGAGMDATTLTVLQPDWPNFAGSFVIEGTGGRDCLVQELRLDGQFRTAPHYTVTSQAGTMITLSPRSAAAAFKATQAVRLFGGGSMAEIVWVGAVDGDGTTGVVRLAAPPNGARYTSAVPIPLDQCGGLSAGHGWLVRRVHVDDMPFFGFWLHSVSNVTVEDCANSRGTHYDSIGGGNCTDARVTRHRWHSTSSGNRFDHVGGTGIVLQDCTDHASSPGGIYLEGLTHSRVEDCTIYGPASVVIQSDGGYAPRGVAQPLGCTVRGCHLLGGGGIKIVYSHAASLVHKGGYCAVENCVVENARGAGIQVVNEVPANSVGGGQIKGNRVVNPNAANVDVANDGYTTYHPSGINANGFLLLVAENTCIDSRNAPLMRYGIEIGGTGRPMADRVTVATNVCSGAFYAPAQINFSAATNSCAVGNYVGNPGSGGGIATAGSEAGNVYWNNAGNAE